MSGVGSLVSMLLICASPIDGLAIRARVYCPSSRWARARVHALPPLRRVHARAAGRRVGGGGAARRQALGAGEGGACARARPHTRPSRAHARACTHARTHARRRRARSGQATREGGRRARARPGDARAGGPREERAGRGRARRGAHASMRRSVSATDAVDILEPFNAGRTLRCVRMRDGRVGVVDEARANVWVEEEVVSAQVPPGAAAARRD